MDQCYCHANMHFKRLPLEHTDHPFNSEDGGVKRELDLLAMNWNTLSRSVQSPVLPWMSSIALRAVCNNCYAHMAAGIQFNMVIRGMSSAPFVYVDSMLLKVYGSLAMNMDVAVSSMGRASVSSRPLTLVPDRQVATITLPVAFIPVQIRFAVGLKAKLTVRTAVPGSLSLGFDYTRMYRMVCRSVTDFVIQPSANLGVQLALAAPGCSGVQYRTYYGLNLGMSLNEIEVQVPLTSWTLSLGGDILPWSSTFTLIEK
ncbi:uncharacterized protein HaLaN_19569, partial [Haematococcus lacustris]